MPQDQRLEFLWHLQQSSGDDDDDENDDDDDAGDGDETETLPWSEHLSAASKLFFFGLTKLDKTQHIFRLSWQKQLLLLAGKQNTHKSAET